MIHPDWHGQNIPCAHIEWGGSVFYMLPALEFLLKYDEDTIDDLLSPPESYGWKDSFSNLFAWAKNVDRVVDIEPDFQRFGCIPSWFPTNDKDSRRLTPQGQVDRFLYLFDLVYGGLPNDHRQANPRGVAAAILALMDDMGGYASVEEGDGMEWDLA